MRWRCALGAALAIALAALAQGAAARTVGELEAGAAGGDAEAAFALATRYEHAEGVGRDPARALDLYCRASRKQHAGAAFAIGWMYANGRGMARDDDQAAAWFRLAAGRGHPQAEKLAGLVRGSDASARPQCPSEPEKPATVAAAFPVIDAPEAIRRLVHDLAPRFALDPRLVLAVIKVESGFRVDAVSPKDAHGLMQLIPATAERFGVRRIYDPAQNLEGGMRYLRWLLDRFAGNLELALAAYNAGENAVARHAGVPPYPETRAYLSKFVGLGLLRR